jgi:glycosyltransferase involved in cell wall biosynthesis
MTTDPGYLLVIPWDLEAPGGVSQMVKNLHRELGTQGWRPTVLVSTWSAKSPSVDNSGSVPVLRWRVRSLWCEGNVLKGLLAFVLTFPAFSRRWCGLARRHDWQVVNVHYPALSGLTWLLLKRLKLWSGVILLSIHGRELRDPMPPRGRVAQWLMGYLLENVDAVVACSTELANDVLRIAPGAAKHVRVIANGISIETLHDELDPSFELPAELRSCSFILNVATFEHKKAQDILVDAFALLATRDPAVRLVLVGRRTPWAREIKQRVAAAGIAHRVHFFYDLPHYQVLTFLTHARIFCLPSRAEGHPVAILEAAALGIPVVSTPVGGIAQTIPDESHGLLVPVGDIPALAGALSRLLAEPGVASAMGKNLQRVVQSQFSSAQTARRYMDLAQTLANRDIGPGP